MGVVLIIFVMIKFVVDLVFFKIVRICVDGLFFICVKLLIWYVYVFCYLILIFGCGDGGWMLVMKIDGNKVFNKYLVS